MLGNEGLRTRGTASIVGALEVAHLCQGGHEARRLLPVRTARPVFGRGCSAARTVPQIAPGSLAAQPHPETLLSSCLSQTARTCIRRQQLEHFSGQVEKLKPALAISNQDQKCCRTLMASRKAQASPGHFNSIAEALKNTSNILCSDATRNRQQGSLLPAAQQNQSSPPGSRFVHSNVQKETFLSVRIDAHWQLECNGGQQRHRVRGQAAQQDAAEQVQRRFVLLFVGLDVRHRLHDHLHARWSSINSINVADLQTWYLCSQHWTLAHWPLRRAYP